MLTRHQFRLALGASLIGNALEWYEFYLFVQFTPIFASLFFPQQSPEAALIQTLSIFTLGFVARPLGTIFFSHLGDRSGRRKALLVSIMLMTIPTFAMGLLPTYAQIGIMAPMLMAFLRLLQGIPAGGEATGVICYLTEIAPRHMKGLMGSFSFFGSQLGAIFSICEFLILHRVIPEQHMMDWGWRISFIVGGLLGVTGLFLRKNLHETPSFEIVREKGLVQHRPILTTLMKYKSPLIKSFFLSALPLSGWYLVFIFSPLYSAQVLGISWVDELVVTLAMIILSNIFLPFFGHLADCNYKRKLMMWGSIGTVLGAFPFYYFGLTNQFGLFLFMKGIMATILTMQYAVLPIILSELFPTSIRYSGVSIGYSFCNIFLGGSAPLLSLTLTNLTGNQYIPAFLLILSALITLFALFSIKPKATELA